MDYYSYRDVEGLLQEGFTYGLDSSTISKQVGHILFSAVEEERNNYLTFWKTDFKLCKREKLGSLTRQELEEAGCFS